MRDEESSGEATALLVLAVLAEGPAHGYEISRRVRQRSAGVLTVREGSLYPVLHALAADGLLSAEWADAGGRRRRVYALTPEGQGTLQREQSNWETRTEAIARVLRGVTGLGTP